MKNSVEVRMNVETLSKVEAYVYKKYKSLEGKSLIVKDMGSHFQVLKNKTGSPIILNKDILN